jgi:hypothetical protein
MEVVEIVDLDFDMRQAEDMPGKLDFEIYLRVEVEQVLVLNMKVVGDFEDMEAVVQVTFFAP